jgi:hypothetical protein
MNVDPRIPFDDAHATRDHRMRAGTGQERAPVPPGQQPGMRPTEGGPTAASRGEHDRLGDAVHAAKDRDAREQRRRAGKGLAQLLGLAEDADLELEVVQSGDTVRFRVRDRGTGAIVAELSAERLRQLTGPGASGNLVDRST